MKHDFEKSMIIFSHDKYLWKIMFAQYIWSKYKKHDRKYNISGTSANKVTENYQYTNNVKPQKSCINNDNV